MSILLRKGEVLSNDEFFDIPADGDGWRTLPDGDWARIGIGTKIGKGVSIGHRASIGSYGTIGSGASIGARAIISDGASIGDRAIIGTYASIGIDTHIGGFANIGSYTRIGNHTSIGDGTRIGRVSPSGDYVNIGNMAVIGEGAIFEASPLAVQGTRHLVIQHSRGKIAIGCEVYTHEEWLENYVQIGKNHSYSPEQIEEYGKIIRFVIANGVEIGGK